MGMGWWFGVSEALAGIRHHPRFLDKSEATFCFLISNNKIACRITTSVVSITTA